MKKPERDLVASLLATVLMYAWNKYGRCLDMKKLEAKRAQMVGTPK